jgi:hypothetical protein
VALQPHPLHLHMLLHAGVGGEQVLHRCPCRAAVEHGSRIPNPNSDTLIESSDAAIVLGMQWTGDVEAHGGVVCKESDAR